MISVCYDESRPIYGIFNRLNEKNKLHYVNIIGETNSNCDFKPNILFIDDKPDSEFWYSTNEDPTLTFQFKYPILLTSYTFHIAGENHTGHSYPRNWTIQGYVKGLDDWEDIDHQDNQQFCPPSKTSCHQPTSVNFPIEYPKHLYTQIKIISEENSMFHNKNNQYIILSSLDFFGSMKIGRTCKAFKHFHYLLSYISTIILMI